MTEQVIPAEAVEAAAKRYYEASTGREWAMLDNFQRPVVLSWMRRALEAAAPHMLQSAKAEAWTEGCKEGLSTNPGWEDEALARNPYKKPAL